MIRSKLLALLVMMILPAAANAACNSKYIVQAGDTLFSIAQHEYGDLEKWTLVYYSNQAVLKGSVLQAEPGMELFIPCAPGQAVPDATPLRQDDAALKFVTGGDYSPFTDRNWPGDGLITELVNAAMEATPDPVTYSVTWEDDWSKHLFPLLDEKKFDMGFPWLKPDCDSTPNNERCANFHFSDPLMKLLIMLFVRANDPMTFNSDQDIIGKTLCRPKGYFTHDLDRAGRRWLSDNLITLVQADSPDACFDLLLKKEVDAVTINVFLGASKINSLGLRGVVVPLERPLSEEGLYVVISKKHWRGTTFLYRFNAGLAALKATDRYNEIVSRHLGIFWNSIKSN